MGPSRAFTIFVQCQLAAESASRSCLRAFQRLMHDCAWWRHAGAYAWPNL